VARPWLAGAVAVGAGQAVLLVGQAAILARLLTGAMYGSLTSQTAARDGAAIALLAVAQGLAGWAWEAWTEAAARRARADTRHRAAAAALDLTPAQYQAAGQNQMAGDAPGPGGLTTLLGAGIDDLDPLVGRVLPRTALALAVPALLLAWIGHLDVISAGLAAVTLVIAPMLAGLVGADTAAAVRRRLTSLERLGDRFDALIEGLPLLRAFGRARDHERAVATSGEEVRTATLATLRIALLAGLVTEILAAVGTALVAVRLGLRLDAGQRVLPQALAVLMLTPEVFLPMRRLTADFHAGATGRAVLARLVPLIAAGRPGAAPAGSELLPRPSAPYPPEPRRSDAGPAGVILDGVSLTAGGRTRPVLDAIDVRVSPGERVCLAGASGAGKTSLLRVVAGLVPPSAGRSHLAGPDLAAGGLPALGWVPQHPTVLAATVFENIALGRRGVDDDRARTALAAVQLGPWLRSLPQGLRTPLRGLDAPLSLGERRRLAIARCLAGPHPQLWLLDEPTAGLDRASAERLVAELSRIIGGTTAIIATHDPLAMTLAERTVELCDGRIHGPVRAESQRGERPQRGQQRALPVSAP
jgi:ATP-binding cassette subfamily C protein CydD